MREQAQGQHDVKGDGPPDQQLRASQHDVECAPRVHWEQSAAVVPEAAVAVVQEAAATRNVGGVEVPPDLPARDRLAAEPAKVLLAAVAGHVVASSALLDGLTALLVGALAKWRAMAACEASSALRWARCSRVYCVHVRPVCAAPCSKQKTVPHDAHVSALPRAADGTPFSALLH